MNRFVAEVLITTQAELGNEAVSPRNTGRFRSSWFAAEGTPSREVAPEGTDEANDDAKGLRIDGEKTYFLSNSLQYAQYVVAGDTVVSQPKTWFTDFTSVRVPKIVDGARRVATKEFES